MGVLSVGARPAGAAFPGKNGKIAFTSLRSSNDDIWVMNSDGSGQKRLTHNGTPGTTSGQDFKPAWSPNGKTIAFTSRRD